jgi:hypothetical protein
MWHLKKFWMRQATGPPESMAINQSIVTAGTICKIIGPPCILKHGKEFLTSNVKTLSILVEAPKWPDSYTASSFPIEPPFFFAEPHNTAIILGGKQ